jgi:hypothetical protein
MGPEKPHPVCKIEHEFVVNELDLAAKRHAALPAEIRHLARHSSERPREPKQHADRADWVECFKNLDRAISRDLRVLWNRLAIRGKEVFNVRRMSQEFNKISSRFHLGALQSLLTLELGDSLSVACFLQVKVEMKVSATADVNLRKAAGIRVFTDHRFVREATRTRYRLGRYGRVSRVTMLATADRSISSTDER